MKGVERYARTFIPSTEHSHVFHFARKLHRGKRRRRPTCTYPSAPCRFPHQLHPSLEGYGFLVKELADAAGMHDHNGPLTVTYFGALLFSLPPAPEETPL